MDKYDKAIEYLGRYPSEIYNAWIDARPDQIAVGNYISHPAGCLFQFAGGTDSSSPYKIGCLTQIRGLKSKEAETEQLTKEIREDKRIPTDPGMITVAHLPVFAEWQRKMDQMDFRKKKEMT